MESKSGITNLSVEELKKYKALLDEGTITEEEFQNIKAEFLKHDGKTNSQPANTSAAKSGVDAYLKFIIPAVVVIMAIIVALVLSARNNNPEAVAKGFAKASYTDEKKEASLYAYDWEKYMSNRYGTSEKFFSRASVDYGSTITSWGEYYKAYDAYWKARHEDKYGKFKVTVEVISVIGISTQDVYNYSPSVASNIVECADFDFDQIDEAMVFTVLTNIKGENGSYMSKDDIYVVKCSGKWGVYSVCHGVS